MTITGRTRCFPLIGFPVDQVRSPPGINAWFAEQGIDAVMFGMDIAPDAVEAFFAVLRDWNNCGGCSVTVPHKQATFQAMDDVSERARRIGAVNIVRREAGGRLVGDMTDGLAFVEALKQKRGPLEGSVVALFGGGGGAGAAIADSLCGEGIAEICIVEPNGERRRRVAAVLSDRYPDVRISDAPGTRAFDVAINASPLGMHSQDSLPFDVGIVKEGGIVADVVTKPEITPLIVAAKQSGRRTQTGIEMADAQLRFQMHHLALWEDAAGTHNESVLTGWAT